MIREVARGAARGVADALLDRVDRIVITPAMVERVKRWCK